MTRLLHRVVSIYVIVALVLLALPVNIVSAGEELQSTGLLEPTAAQAEWMKKNFPVIKKIRLNEIAFERINTERLAKGLKKFSRFDLDVSSIGNEFLFGTSGETGSETSDILSDSPLPGSVDNSASPAFPPIRSQGGIGSCAAWATTYYQFTYETNLALGRTASNGDNNVIFSPKWTYNLINGGQDAGSSFASAYNLELKNGAASWNDFPYDTNYLAWPVDGTTWREALNYRPQSYGSLSNDDPEVAIESLKTQLTNGHVMVIATYVYSWVSKYVGNDPATAEDDAFVNQRIATYMKNTSSGGHGMTVVGYNDNLWCDLNGNGTVDTGEKGAFKIANSWGPSDWNSGFRWVCYDALRTTSAVAAYGTWPTTDRATGGIFRNNYSYTLTVSADFDPVAVAEITLNSAKRSQILGTLGTGTTSNTTPSSTWNTQALNYAGGNYAFDGTTTACDATFFFDFTDLADSASGTTRWFAGINDKTAGDATTVKSYKLYKVTDTGDVLMASDSSLPKSVDGAQNYAWVDCDLDSVNQTPTAVINISASSGSAPLTVEFDGSFSTDADGTIVSYAWDFGDGSSGTNTSASHTYTSAGGYTAVLAVTDDGGDMDSASAVITVTSANSTPTDLTLSGSSVAENQAIGTAVGTFSTTDPDSGNTFVYGLVSGNGSMDNGSFTINGTTLKTAAIFDYETKPSYSIRVRTTDQDGLYYEEAFTITVSNVNEAPTDITLSGSSVAENQAIGTTVGTFSTTDPDSGNTFIYSLVSGTGSTDNGSFTINGTTLKTAAIFDYESKPSYSIRVRTTDQDGLYYEEAFTITVSNVNEAPTDITLSGSSVAENQAIGTAVGTFSTTDPDSGNTFIYSLVSGNGSTDNGSFTINGNYPQDGCRSLIMRLRPPTVSG